MKRSVKLSGAVLLAMAMLLALPRCADAQITSPRLEPTQRNRLAKLDELLINRLKATTEDQKAYVRDIVRRVNNRTLELRLVLAMERFARRRSPFFPLPYFERALRVEAAKRGIAVPSLQQFVATTSARRPQATSPSDSRILR